MSTTMLASFSRSSRVARAALSAAAGGQTRSATAWRDGATHTGCHVAARAMSSSASGSGSGDAQPGLPMRGLALAVTAALAGGGLWVSHNAIQVPAPEVGVGKVAKQPFRLNLGPFAGLAAAGGAAASSTALPGRQHRTLQSRASQLHQGRGKQGLVASPAHAHCGASS